MHGAWGGLGGARVRGVAASRTPSGAPVTRGIVADGEASLSARQKRVPGAALGGVAGGGCELSDRNSF